MKQTKTVDRILAAILAFVMLASLVPMSVFASTDTYKDSFTFTVRVASFTFAPLRTLSIIP